MRISFRTAAVGALALAMLSIVVQPAAAAVSTGYLDHTFSDDGKVLTNAPGTTPGKPLPFRPTAKSS
jgi:Spy/CpxP family protein refolding chaperone